MQEFSVGQKITAPLVVKNVNDQRIKFGLEGLGNEHEITLPYEDAKRWREKYLSAERTRT